MRATLRDIARLAGVSIATASRTLNGDGTHAISEETQAHVWEAAQQLNYHPNDAAQRLARRGGTKTQNTYSIGLIMSNVAYQFSDPFWSQVIDGINNELNRLQYHLRFAFLLDDLQNKQHRLLLDPLFIDGLILLGTQASRAHLDALFSYKHTVLISGDPLREDGALPLDVIDMEKRRAIYEIVAHLAALGRTRLAFVGPSTNDRADAFLHALDHHHLPHDEHFCIETRWSSESAYDAVAALLNNQKKAFDALVCGSDIIAIGAIRAAKEYDLRIPDDLAITGFDDIPFAQDLDPPLTTIHVPQKVLGELAARRVIERVTAPDLPAVIQTVPTKLVVRASCGAQLTSQVQN